MSGHHTRIGLAHIRSRAYVYGWRLRYWWMDTDSGQFTRFALLCISLLAAGIHFAMAAYGAWTQPPTIERQLAYINPWVVQLIIAVVMSLISYALRPKPQSAPPRDHEAPTVEDGQGIHEVHGDVWIEDPFINAQRLVGKEPIKSGGKK